VGSMLWCSSSNASIYILVVTTFRFSNRLHEKLILMFQFGQRDYPNVCTVYCSV
jgi:hypothetical protein